MEYLFIKVGNFVNSVLLFIFFNKFFFWFVIVEVYNIVIIISMIDILCNMLNLII